MAISQIFLKTFSRPLPYAAYADTRTLIIDTVSFAYYVYTFSYDTFRNYNNNEYRIIICKIIYL